MFDSRSCVTLALMTLATVVGVAPVDAQSEGSRPRLERRSSERERPAVRREAAARPGRRTYSAHSEQEVRTSTRREASSVRQRPIVNAMAGSHLVGSGHVHVVSRAVAGGQVRVTRYDNTLSGTVERVVGPGLMSRTFVSGGHVLYAHVYQRHVWRQFGRAFAYETFVSAVRYPGVYYAWALTSWPHPVSYAWGWRAQPWYPVYGSVFTPYPAYTSPDLWMTDYIIAQSMQTAYQAQPGAPVSAPVQQNIPVAPAPDSSVAVPLAQPGAATPPPQPSEVPQVLQTSAASSAPVAGPPTITPQVKAQLNTQIKVLLQEQQAAAATPATLTSQSTPPALRPNHVFFQVVQPLDVPLSIVAGHCSLNANDYIKRTGEMSDDDWMIPVEVELSRSSDCPEGLRTRIGLNDLNAMENEQEAQVMEAMQAASKSMGPNGPPSGPGAHPILIADGSAAPDPMALDAIRQAH
jgi:hypothetical protein